MPKSLSRAEASSSGGHEMVDDGSFAEAFGHGRSNGQGDGQGLWAGRGSAAGLGIDVVAARGLDREPGHLLPCSPFDRLAFVAKGLAELQTRSPSPDCPARPWPSPPPLWSQLHDDGAAATYGTDASSPSDSDTTPLLGWRSSESATVSPCISPQLLSDGRAALLDGWLPILATWFWRPHGEHGACVDLASLPPAAIRAIVDEINTWVALAGADAAGRELRVRNLAALNVYLSSHELAAIGLQTAREMAPDAQDAAAALLPRTPAAPAWLPPPPQQQANPLVAWPLPSASSGDAQPAAPRKRSSLDATAEAAASQLKRVRFAPPQPMAVPTWRRNGKEVPRPTAATHRAAPDFAQPAAATSPPAAPFRQAAERPATPLAPPAAASSSPSPRRAKAPASRKNKVRQRSNSPLAPRIVPKVEETFGDVARDAASPSTSTSTPMPSQPMSAAAATSHPRCAAPAPPAAPAAPARPVRPAGRPRTRPQRPVEPLARPPGRQQTPEERTPSPLAWAQRPPPPRVWDAPDGRRQVAPLLHLDWRSFGENCAFATLPQGTQRRAEVLEAATRVWSRGVSSFTRISLTELDRIVLLTDNVVALGQALATWRLPSINVGTLRHEDAQVVDALCARLNYRHDLRLEQRRR